VRHGFHVLGPVELWAADRQVDLGPGKQRAVLAVLLLGSGRPCSVETLIDRLWGEDPPAQARNALYSYISRLRRVLREAQLDSVALRQRNGGYLLEASPDLVDVHRFDAAVQQARCTQDPGAQADLLRGALDCWHGTPLADLPGQWADEMRHALGKRRVGACADWAAAMIELGRHTEAVDLLERELVEYPAAEPLAGRLMTALHRQGRHAEALACYAALRRRLVDDLGAEPGPALQQLHLEILRSGEPVAAGDSEVAVVLNQLADAGLIVINEDGVAIVHQRLGTQETRKRRRPVRPALVGVSFVLAVLMLFAGFTVVQIDQANWRRDQALSARLAADARSQLVREPELALLLAKRAVEIDPSEFAQAVLAQALTESRIRATWRGHEGPVTGLDISLDGQRVVTSGSDKTVRLWSTSDAHDTIVLTGHTGAVRDAVFSPASDRVASASDDGSVRIWTVGERPSTLRIIDSAGVVVALAWNPDGQRLAGAGADGKVRIWQADGSEVILDGHQEGANAVAWSPDGNRLASVGNDGKLVVRDLVSEAVSSRASAGGALSDVAWSTDGRQILTGSADATTRIWPAATDGPPVDIDDHQDAMEDDHQDAVKTVAYSHNGRYLVTGGRDRTAYIAPVDGRGDKVVLRGTNGPIRDVAFSHDDQLVVTASEDGTVRLWDPSPKPGLRTVSAHASATTDTAVSPDGENVASVGDDGKARIGGRLLDASRKEPLKAVAFSPDNKMAAAAGEGRTVLVWPVAGGAVQRLQTGHRGTIWSVAISGQNIATAGEEGTVQISSLAVGQTLAVLSAHAGPVRDVAYSPDGRLLASAHSDGTVRVWTFSGSSKLVLRGTDGMRTIAFSPDSQFIAGVGNDGTIRVWRTSGEGSPVLLQGHYGRVDGIAFSDDGQYIASTGSDQKVRLWKWAVRTDPIVFEPHAASAVTSIDFGHGQQLAVGRGDGAVDTWTCEVCVPVRDLLELAAKRVTRELTDEERKLYLAEPK
jgi:WD40 repeat protein/DNA-binding SARP family transcriptional activator